ncbi:UDP-glycosyltransferase UGT5-like [Neocloeon triangulifer]|uniref:UDP-glycosyltransferase UGT5-like n=1 Tax=Neocloeon triangulifer TaxID=2078957 RepID=UPI00286F04D5|nr:UDP-glycosyltransferase UGT5-like [Neocloeon triangulifer]
MNINCAFLLLFVAYFANSAFSARILGVFPWPGKSHMITFSAITHALAERGHELVVVSTYPSKKPPANYTDIDTWPSLKVMYDEMMASTDIFEFEDVPKIFHPALYLSMGVQAVELMTFQDEQVQKLLKDERGFDLIIAEDFVCDGIFAFAQHFKAPLILISSFGGYPWQNYAVGNPYNPAYATNNLLEFSDRKTFWERFVNTIYNHYWDFAADLYYYPRQNQLARDFFGPGLPSVKELRKTASLSMTNSHFSTNYVRPLVPAFIEVGGMHVKPPTKPLPAEMQKWIDEAEHGVIYFSLGSNVQSSIMPDEKRKAFLDAFSELPQRVLWKWETENLPGKPDNVMISQWAPQMEILAHPNVKLFISHGGLLSGQEAMYNGVPVVGIPFFGDQIMNVQRAENEGYGIMLPFKKITKESVLSAVKKGLHDEKIREQVKLRQGVYLDQPQTPLERAVFWTEYVLRHNGAPHLRSAALDLTWYQLGLIDVYAFILLLLIGFVSISVLLCNICLCRKIGSKNKVE